MQIDKPLSVSALSMSAVSLRKIQQWRAHYAANQKRINTNPGANIYRQNARCAESAVHCIS
jgi:hypothetical protein